MGETGTIESIRASDPKERYFRELDSIIESPNRKQRFSLSEHIYHVRESLLDIVEQDPLQSPVTERSKSGEYRFTRPEGREIAKKKVAEYIRYACQKFEKNPTEETFTHAFGGIIALGELTLFPPKSIYESMEHTKNGTAETVGINPKQIDAIISLFSSHSTRVDSGQGKSNPDAVLASIAKVLLKHVQVHNYVIDEFARERDSEQIKKMAEQLSLPVFVFSEQDAKISSTHLYNKLTAQRSFLSQLPPTPNRSALLHKIELKISAYDRANAYARARESLLPSAQLEAPAIAIGTDGDFKFAYLKKEHPELFTGRIEAIADEGDLQWRTDTVNVLEAPNSSAVEGYLPDWISMIVAEHVCKRLVKNGDIINQNGFYTFNDEVNDDSIRKYERQFKRGLQKIQETGRLPSEFHAALVDRLRTIQESLPVHLRMSTQDMHKSAIKLIQSYAKLPAKDYPINFYAQAWMQALPMKDGTEYAAANNTVHVIDRHTGRQLTSHRYQDLLDVAVDVAQGVCSLRGGGDIAQASIGHWSFLQSVYGEKQYAILTMTTDGIEEEIKEILKKPIVNSERWIGKPVPIPDHAVEESQDDAIETLRQLTENPRPHLIVTDNDHEVEDIQEALLATLPEHSNVVISTITSKSTIEEEKEIYKNAGLAHHITIANPKAGRMIDIKTSQESDMSGGLRVVAWGPLHAKDVLIQVLQRAKRAGHPGSAEWITYKHGGHVGLADHALISMYPTFKEEMEAIPSKTSIPYDFSLIEKMHARQFELTASRRLQIWYEDTIRTFLTHSIKEAIGKQIVIKEDKVVTIDDHLLFTPAYVEKFLDLHSSIIQSTAHAEAKLKSITTIDQELRKIGGDLSHVRKLASELVTFQRSSPLARDLNKLKIDAIGEVNEPPSVRLNRTIPAWERLHAAIQNTSKPKIITLPIPKKITSLVSLAPEIHEIGGIQRIRIGEYIKSEKTERIILSDLPNILLTVKRVVLGATSKNNKRIPMVHEFSYRITTMNPVTKSIDDDITISYTSRVQKNGKLNKKHDQAYLKEYVELLMNTLKMKGADKKSINASIKQLRKLLRMKKFTTFKGAQTF